ncbi:unnamed protein product, partial [Pleuronectes platessa]
HAVYLSQTRQELYALQDGPCRTGAKSNRAVPGWVCREGVGSGKAGEVGAQEELAWKLFHLRQILVGGSAKGDVHLRQILVGGSAKGDVHLRVILLGSMASFEEQEASKNTTAQEELAWKLIPPAADPRRRQRKGDVHLRLILVGGSAKGDVHLRLILVGGSAEKDNGLGWNTSPLLVL